MSHQVARSLISYEISYIINSDSETDDYGKLRFIYLLTLIWRKTMGRSYLQKIQLIKTK